MTPQEWRELDPRDAAFLANAYSYHNSEMNRERKQLEMRTKRRR